PLRWAPLRYLGKLCFGLYLLHRPADTLATAVIARIGLDPEALIWIPIKMAVAVGLATLSWHLLEQPFLRLKERFSSTGRLVAVGLLALAACKEPRAELQPANDGFARPDQSVTPVPPRPPVIPPDAAPPDASVPAPAGHVLYPEGRVHSPLTADI